jgi:ClpP class serine protease
MIRALDLLTNSAWAIQPEMMDQIIAIAQRAGAGPEAVAAELGRPLKNARVTAQRDDAAIIPITGPIFRRANLFTEISGATSVEVLATDLATAINDPTISRIVLEIDSPGGEATGIAELAALIHASDKPVIAYVDGIAASAAYWLAAAADQIVMASTAQVGSIGVVASFRPEEDGPIKVISSLSPLKHIDPATDAGRSEIQRVVDDLAAVFVADVAAYRHTDEATVMSDFGQGGILVGQKAVAAGMADRIGTYESLFNAGKTGPTQRLTAMTQASTPAPEITRASLAVSHPELLNSIVEDAKTEGYAIGHAEGLSEGAIAERARIQSVREQAIPGHEALIERLAFDGETSAEQAAVQVLAAERGARAAQQSAITDQTPAPAPAAAAPTPEPPQDFEAKVEALIEIGQSRGQAIRTVAAAYPELHKAYLGRVNP